MPIISFTSQALSAYGQSPANLSWSVSGGSVTNKTVELLTVGTGPINNASLSAKRVRGIAFNALTSPASGTGTFTTTPLSAATGTTFRVDRAHNGATFAVLYTDGSSTLFTCVTGTAAQSLTSNNFDTTYPEIRRLFVLGYR